MFQHRAASSSIGPGGFAAVTWPQIRAVGVRGRALSGARRGGGARMNTRNILLYLCIGVFSLYAVSQWLHIISLGGVESVQ